MRDTPPRNDVLRTTPANVPQAMTATKTTDPKTTIHLIRHGDAIPDAATAFSEHDGYDEMGLSRKGLTQARALAARLQRTLALGAIYSSPTRRAYETAFTIATACEREVRRDVRLREIGLGDESLPPALAPEARAKAIRERLESLATTALRDGSWAGVPEVEPSANVRARVGAALADIVARHAGEHVAIVSHAGTINAYFAGILGTTHEFFFPIGNTSLSSIRLRGGRTTLLRLNDTAHLERERTVPASDA